jgi:segregation and condensation protein A
MEPEVASVEEFTIKTDAFEGPLDLLLDLVERRKLLINDISLAEVTDEYMRHVSAMQQLSLPNTAAFVELADTLLLIKSKSLLPVLELTPEEEEGIDDLEERLKRYALYRDAAHVIQECFGTQIAHEKQYVPDRTPLFVTDRFTTVDALHDAIRNVLVNLPRKIDKPKVKVRKTISLEDMMHRLHQQIKQQMKLRFSELIADNTEKTHQIVGFLAILESVKQGSILVAQLHRFADIEISPEESTNDVPRYM